MNFLLIQDHDSLRRKEVLGSAVDLMNAFIPGGQAGELTAGDCAFVWSLSPKAPVSIHRQDGFSAIFGDGFHKSKKGPILAVDLFTDRREKKLLHEIFDGYYLAVECDEKGSIRIKTDLLGIFPVYYSQTEDGVFLVSSSPKLILAHPSAKPEIDPKGLIGILLLNGIFKNRTLYEGIARLDYGARLEKERGVSAREEKIFTLSGGTPNLADEFFEKHLNQIDQTLEQIIREQVIDSECGLSLSGGLDSRMIAGYLKRIGKSVHAITFGRSNDNEMQCASKVANVLGFKHTTSEIFASSFSEHAFRDSDWTCLAGGFSTTWAWSMKPYLEKLPRRAVLGYIMDCVLGWSMPKRAYPGNKDAVDFQRAFWRVNVYGIEPKNLKGLLADSKWQDIIDDVVDEIEEWYLSLGQSEFRRIWLFELLTRQRFYTGSVVWRSSFGAWPILPVLSKKLLDLASNIPAASIGGRRLQIVLLRKSFPELSALPYDANHPHPFYLNPTLMRRIVIACKSKIKDLIPQKGMRLFIQRKGQYYRPFFDVLSPGWRNILQRCAEQVIDRPKCFNETEWNEAMSRLKQGAYQDTFAGPSGDKMLLGFSILSHAKRQIPSKVMQGAV